MDNIILIVFGILSSLSTAFGVFSFWRAAKYARRNDSEAKMIAWAVAGLAGLVFGTVSFVYFILPILSARLFS
jgi:anaerobic C4-dicarboxylate transporter